MSRKAFFSPLSTARTPKQVLSLFGGKTLLVALQGRSEADEEGMVRLFFELNGQPRTVRVPDRVHGASKRVARRKAEGGVKTDF